MQGVKTPRQRKERAVVRRRRARDLVQQTACLLERLGLVDIVDVFLFFGNHSPVRQTHPRLAGVADGGQYISAARQISAQHGIIHGKGQIPVAEQYERKGTVTGQRSILHAGGVGRHTQPAERFGEGIRCRRSFTARRCRIVQGQRKRYRPVGRVAELQLSQPHPPLPQWLRQRRADGPTGHFSLTSPRKMDRLPALATLL